MSASGSTPRKRTSEQLKRKREFDKENQRIFRQRRKLEVATLKSENEELRARLETAEQEIASLTQSKAQLETVIQNAAALLQGAAFPHSLPPQSIRPPTAVPHPASPGPLHVRTLVDDLTNASAKDPMSLPPVSAGISARPEAASNALTVAHDPSSIAITEFDSGLIFDMKFPPEFSSVLQAPGNETYDASLDPSRFTISFPGYMMPPRLDDEPWIPALPEPTATTYLEENESPTNPPPWARVPTYINATCRLDASLLAAVRSGRESLNSGQLLLENFESSFPSIGSLLNPQNRSMMNPISSAIGKHGKISLLAAGLPERMGLMYNMCLLVRWLVSPTRVNYEAMPDYLRPLEKHLEIPHPIWIDTVPWPEARELYLREMDWNQFEHLRAVSLKSTSVNWSFTERPIVKALSKTELTLDDAFIRHVRDVSSWTMGPEVADEFPFLKRIPEIFRAV